MQKKMISHEGLHLVIALKPKYKRTHSHAAMFGICLAAACLCAMVTVPRIMIVATSIAWQIIGGAIRFVFSLVPWITEVTIRILCFIDAIVCNFMRIPQQDFICASRSIPQSASQRSEHRDPSRAVPCEGMRCAQVQEPNRRSQPDLPCCND